MGGRLLGLAAIFGVGMALTALLTVAWMLLLTYGKKKADDMDGDKWDAYFRSLPLWGYLVRGLLFLFLALWVTVPLLWAALRLFRYGHRPELCALFVALTAAAVAVRYIRKRRTLLEKINTLKSPQ